MNRQLLLLTTVIVTIGLGSCNARETTQEPSIEELTKITLMLDWVPNTNHTGQNNTHA